MRSWANYLAPYSIRVNSVAPSAVNTPMADNEMMGEALEKDPGMANAWMNALPVMVVEAIDIANAIAWLVSDDARYVTGSVGSRRRGDAQQTMKWVLFAREPEEECHG
jgi:NAD(P)-dependent dehydrogenase (short-subunit alcohol dehydrogenase family)